MEVPSYYLHPHHYVKLKDILGAALVAEPNGLTQPEACRSRRRRSTIIAAPRPSPAMRWKALLSAAREGARELELSGAAYQKILIVGQLPPGQHHEPR